MEVACFPGVYLRADILGRVTPGDLIVEADVAFAGQVVNRRNYQMAQQAENSHSKAVSTWIGIPCAAAQEARGMGKSLCRQAYLGIKSAV